MSLSDSSRLATVPTFASPVIMRNVLVTLATLGAALSLTHTAHAAAGDGTARPLAQPAAPAASEDDGSKSESLAVALAVGGSLVGPVLIATALHDADRYNSPLHGAVEPMLIAGGAAIVFGPSIGNWYAGKGVSRGLVLRIGGAALTALGAAVIISSADFFNSQGSSSDQSGGLLLGVVGAGMVLGGTVSDILSAPRAAADDNRRRRGARLSVAPLVSHAGGAHQAGLAVVGAF
jgi:hypothetical protein